MNANRGSPWRKLAGFTFVLVVLILFQNSYTQAQTQTVQDLKGQINAIEELKRMSPTPAIVEATYSEPATPATPTTAARSQDSKGESTSTK